MSESYAYPSNVGQGHDAYSTFSSSPSPNDAVEVIGPIMGSLADGAVTTYANGYNSLPASLSPYVVGQFYTTRFVEESGTPITTAIFTEYLVSVPSIGPSDAPTTSISTFDASTTSFSFSALTTTSPLPSTSAPRSSSHAIANAVTSSSSASTPTPPPSNNAVIASYDQGTFMPIMVGGILGALAALALLVWWACWYRRKRRRRAIQVREARGGEGVSPIEDEVGKGYRITATSSPSLGSGVTLRPNARELAGVVQQRTEDLVDDRSRTPTPTSTDMRMVPRALLAPVTPAANRSDSRPESMWTDDSELDVMAIDGSSYTRTLSTISSSPSTLTPDQNDDGTYRTIASRRTRAPELDHPGYTYVSTNSGRARPELFGIDTALSPTTTAFNSWPAIGRPVTSPTPPYTPSPVDSYHTRSTGTSPLVRGNYSASPITPVTRHNPFADPLDPRRSLESVHSEVPPAYAELYREDGTRV